MARRHPVQTSFTAGEYSPHLRGRVDIGGYFNSTRMMRNWLPLPQGPVTKRPGFEYITSTRTVSEVPRLIPFVFNRDQAYVLEFGDEYVRIFRNRAVVLSGTEIENGDFVSDISGWTNKSTGTGAISYSSGTMALATGTTGNEAIAEQTLEYMGIEEYTLGLDVIDNSVTVRVGTTSGGTDVLSDTVVTVGTSKTVTFTPSESGTVYLQIENHNTSTTAKVDNISLDTPEYVIKSPFTLAQAFELDYVQSADILYIAHGSRPPMVLARYGAAQWVFQDLNIKDGPYEETNADSAKLLKVSNTTGSVTVTATGHTPFTTNDIGRWVRIQYTVGSDTTWGAAQITAYTSPTQVTATVLDGYPFGAATTDSEVWRLGKWSDGLGWPSLVELHEQRLTFARTEAYPDWLWTTESSGWAVDRVLMHPTTTTGQVTAASAISLPLGSYSAIEWLSSGNRLAIGTQEAEWLFESGDSTKAVSPETARVRIATTSGVNPDVKPIRVDGQIIYSQNTGFKLNEFIFSFESDAYLSRDITIFSNHICRPGVVDSTRCKEPFSVLWWATSDGDLVALTYVADQEVGGLTRHEFTNGLAKRITSIPSEDNTFNELWVVIQREIDGSTVNYIEVSSNPYFEEAVTAPRYCDSYLENTYGSPTATITGLDHLEGEEVVIFADGGVQVGKTVSGGSVTLEEAATVVVVGLKIESTMLTQTYSADTVFGKSDARVKRLSDVEVLVHKTQGLKLGRDLNNLNDQGDQNPYDLIDNEDYLYTGWLRYQFSMDWGNDASFYIYHDEPLPATVCMLAMRGAHNEG